MTSQHPSSGEGSDKRKRGRPALGKPEQVRLSEHERALALELGDGVLAKGLRIALTLATQDSGNPTPAGLDPAEARELLSALRILNNGTELDAQEIARQVAQLRQATDQALKKHSFKQVVLSAEDLAIAQEMGLGSVKQGVHVALQAAKFLGAETARKFKIHGSGS